LEPRGKFLVLKRILELEGLSPKDCVVIVDDRNNAPMLFQGMVKIGYNPDFVIRLKADHVVTRGLKEILSAIDGEKPKRQTFPSMNEVFREIIHACGVTVPILSSFFGLYAIALLIVAVTFLYAFSETAMMEGKHIPLIHSITRHAATHAELHGFAASPIFFALGILLTLLLFPAATSNAAIAIFALGDSTASIFGSLFGKKALPFNKGKTLEGLIFGFFFGFLAAAFFTDSLKALVGAAVAMLVEGLPLPVNDNLVVPLAAAVTLAVMA
ncbi:MAG: phosphatidate cytidylyltransferase, partial [Candidatus Bathyarchaeia archaeon]